MENLKLKDMDVLQLSKHKAKKITGGFLGIGPLSWHAGVRAAGLSRWMIFETTTTKQLLC